jgi:hypothetical protein
MLGSGMALVVRPESVGAACVLIVWALKVAASEAPPLLGSGGMGDLTLSPPGERVAVVLVVLMVLAFIEGAAMERAMDLASEAPRGVLDLP